MKKFIALIVLLAVAAGAYFYLQGPTSTGFELEEGYTLLYNGKNLDGWRKVGGGATFAAEGEAIVGRRGPGENTFLRTDKTFADFSLKMQMRWDEFGNSGVMFRAAQRKGSGRTYGYQYELDHAERAWSGGIYDEARRGWIANLENNAAAREAIRLDDWNDIEIEARGASLKTFINGVPAADIVDGLDAEGFIALQVHSGETGVIRWRHIRIRELEPVMQPGDSLLNAGEWREAPAGLEFTDSAITGPATEDGWLGSRRLFNDAMVQMTVPACDEPTIVQMRHRVDGNGNSAGLAEVKIYADRAEGRVVTPAGEQVLEPVALPKRDRHAFIGLTRGDYAVLTVGKQDALRIAGAGLDERGKLRILPARCGERFELGDVAWYSLKERSAEPLFYQTLDAPPAPVLTPDEALNAFKIAPGFEIELVAAEPLVEDPVAMAWDEYGRLYVVELRGYMPDAYGTGSEEPVGQVVRLEDTDGDGRMDRSEVFLGELVNPRAVAVVNEGILIGEPPELWLCEVPTRDSLCANKRSVGGYAVDVGAANVEHMENGLRQGLDNWLYNSKSARSLKLVDGELQEREGPFRGQWGISKDDYGRLFYNHNSTWVQADLFQGEDLVVPGVESYPKGLGENLTSNPQVYSVRVNPGVNRAYLDGTLREDGRLQRATGVSGLAVYRGDQFPAQYAGDIFAPESAGNVVAQFAVTEKGMALQASQRLYDDAQWGKRDFLGSTDERFRPVDAMNGPDGALYIIDMYRGIIQDDHFLTDELREQIFQRGLDTPVGLGRVWRVRHTQGTTPSPAVVLADASNEELLAALAHGNGWVRDTAQRLLLAREGELAPALAQIAQGDNTLAALHAIWTLEGRGELGAGLVLQLATGEDPWRSVHALRAGATRLSEQQLLSLFDALQEAPPRLSMQLAFATANHSEDAALRAKLADLLAAHDNTYLRQAVVRALRGRELAFLEEAFSAGALDADTEANRAVLTELGANAYQHLRGDPTSDALANPELLQLLAVTNARAGGNAWQQIALLRGFESAANVENFEPAHFEAAPPIFADASVGEADPLWDARLRGRRAFTWPGDELALGIRPLSPEQLQLMQQGEVFYVQCAACHGADGRGVTGLAPALAGASWVTGPPEWLGRIILQGMKGPVEVNGEVFEGVMPPHGHLPELDDATLAGLMTYMRRSFGNRADPVSEEQARQIRADSSGRDTPWTAQEIKAVPYDRGFARFEGKYTISFVTMTVEERPEGLHLSVPMYGGGILEQLSDTTFRGSAGDESISLEFMVEENGSVNKMVMLRKGERIPLKRKE
ncbi:MAG: hypothetical protein Hals2KO_35380 [Halioglobus sp.]